jgi:hypothetical protein
MIRVNAAITGAPHQNFPPTEISGIIGMSFLTAVGAVIDLAQLEIAKP